jgi:hypothetical protein
MTASGSRYQSDEAKRRQSVSFASSISFNRSFALAFVLRVRDEGAAGVTRRARGPGGAGLISPAQGEVYITDQNRAAPNYADARPEIVIHLAAVVGEVGANRDNPGRWPPHDGQPAGDSLRLPDRIKLRSERGYSPGRGGIAT